MPQTTGISTAAVPVLDKKPDIRPTMSMMAMISCRSLLAKRVTRPPILLAMPVSNRAWPTTNIPTQRITLELTYPSKASAGVRTPARQSPTDRMVAVSARGIFSSTNMITAKARKQRVRIVGFTEVPPS